jgi:hypothetical protein
MATERPAVPMPTFTNVDSTPSRASNFESSTAPKGEIVNSAAVAPRAAKATDETPITRANLSMKPEPRASEKSPTPVDEDGIPFLTNEGPEGTSLKHALGITGNTDARRASYSPIPQYITITGNASGSPTKPGKAKKLETKTVDNKYGGTREDVGNSRTYYKLSDIVNHLASRKHMSDKDAALHQEYSTRLEGHQKRIEARRAAGETVPTLKDNRTFINSTYHLPKGRAHSSFITTDGSRKKVQFTTQNIHDAIKKAGGVHLATRYPYTEE